MDIGRNQFYVGTARGLLLSTGEKPSDIKIYKNDESTEVTALTEGRNQNEIILGYHNGHVDIFNTETETFSKKITDLEGDEQITGIGHVKKSLILAKRDGIINIWSKKKNDYFSINLDEKGSLDVMVSDTNRENIVGTGGEYNDFKLWDVHSRNCVFKAKSLGHDELQLPIPTTVRGISFFPNDVNVAACCTKEGQVLVYDERAQRRPIIKFIEKKASYTTISAAYKDRHVLVGTSRGYVQWLDLRAPKILKTFTTFTGSVTGLSCSPTESYVASVSLDRYLRVHNMETKELVYKSYMKQNLTALVVKPIIKDEELSEEKTINRDEVDQEYEDLFESMEQVQDEVKKPKRKSVGLSEQSVKKYKKKNKS